MKVLIVNKFLYPNGGSETYIFKIGQQLQQMRHEVQYFGMEHEGRIVGNHAESYTADMDFHTGKLQKLMYPFKIIYSKEARKKIRRVLDDFQPDVVHLNNINFQITPSVIDEIAAYRKQTGRTVRIIYTAHDYQWVCPNHTLMIPGTGELCTKCIDGAYGNCARNNCIHSSKIRSVLGTLEADLYQHRGTYGLVDTVICPSEYMKNILMHNRFINGRLVVMHNFISDSKKTEKMDESLQKKLPEKYVLYFGRYDQLKGIRTLLNACRQLDEIPFVFAGKGELKSEIDSVCNITEVGFQSGSVLRQLIEKAAFTVFPSEYYENCPFSVMESQMYGTPVIASDRGGTPELVEKGKTGELFRCGDENDLKDKIEIFWNDSRRVERYHHNCIQMVEKGDISSVQKYCEDLIDIYEGGE